MSQQRYSSRPSAGIIKIKTEINGKRKETFNREYQQSRNSFFIKTYKNNKTLLEGITIKAKKWQYHK